MSAPEIPVDTADADAEPVVEETVISDPADEEPDTSDPADEGSVKRDPRKSKKATAEGPGPIDLSYNYALEEQYAIFLKNLKKTRIFRLHKGFILLNRFLREDFDESLLLECNRIVGEYVEDPENRRLSKLLIEMTNNPLLFLTDKVRRLTYIDINAYYNDDINTLIETVDSLPDIGDVNTAFVRLSNE